MNSSTYCLNDMTFWKLLKHVVKKDWLLVGAVLFLLAANPLRDVVLPHLIGKLSKHINNGNSIINTVITITAVIIVIQVLYVFHDRFETIMQPGTTHNIREIIIKHIFKIHSLNYNEVEMGEVITRLMKLPEITYNFINNIKNQILPNVLTIIVATVYFFWVNKLLGTILLCVTALSVYSNLNVFMTCKYPAQERDRHFGMLFSNIDDIMRNMLTVMNFNKEEQEVERLLMFQDSYSASTTQTFQCTLYSKYFVNPLIIGFVLFTIYYCYTRVQKKKMETSTFLSLIIIAFIYMKSSFNITYFINNLILQYGIIENSLGIFDECYYPREQYTLAPRQVAGIHFQDVEFKHFSKDMERTVFQNLNLTIHFNEVTLVLGEIGSGKSTLMSLLLKFRVPTKGEIFMAGIPYSKISHFDLRNTIFYIPQIPILLNRTVFENIAYGYEHKITRKNVMDVITQQKLETFIYSLPKGLDTPVGIHGSKLSGGQRQIIWIIKAILVNPQIIIMDEPTASVDENTKSIVIYLLQHMIKQRTVILITHDPYLIPFANRIITLHNGLIVQDESKHV